jgi:hypothetical protein
MTLSTTYLTHIEVELLYLLSSRVYVRLLAIYSYIILCYSFA